MTLSKQIRFWEIKTSSNSVACHWRLLERGVETVATLCEANELHFRKDEGEASVILQKLFNACDTV